jgi:hypothetical protein
MGYTALTAFIEAGAAECTDHTDWVKRMYFGPWRDLNVPPEISDHLVCLLDFARDRAVIEERLRVAREEAKS